MRKGFSARALLHLFQGPASRTVGAPLPLSALCWVPPEGHQGQRWQVSAVHVKDHIMHVFRSFPFYLAILSGIEIFASLDLQTTLPQLTGLRSQQTPSHSPLTQEFFTQVFNPVMFPSPRSPDSSTHSQPQTNPIVPIASRGPAMTTADTRWW